MTNTTAMPAKAPAAASVEAGAVTAPTQFIETRLETYDLSRRRAWLAVQFPASFVQQATLFLDS